MILVVIFIVAHSTRTYSLHISPVVGLCIYHQTLLKEASLMVTESCTKLGILDINIYRAI